MAKSEGLPVSSEDGPKEKGANDQLAELRHEVDRVFDPFGRSWPNLWHSLGVDKSWKGFDMDLSPRVDIAETDKAYEIAAELPGMDENDIDVSVSNGNLVLKGEKRQWNQTKKRDYHRTERSYGQIRRSLPMPQGVNHDNISAKFKKGVLTITLPKTKKARKDKRKIQVNGK